MIFNVAVVVFGVGALVVYIAGARRGRPAAVPLMVLLVTACMIAFAVALLLHPPVQRHLRLRRATRRRERAVSEYMEELGFALGRVLAGDIAPGARVLVIGGPGGYLGEAGTASMRKALEAGAGAAVDLIPVPAPECRHADCYNEILEGYEDAEIDVVISSLPIGDRRELIYELEDLALFGWDDAPLFAGVCGYHYNPPLLRSYLQQGLLRAVVVYPDEDGRLTAVSAGNMEVIPEVSPGEKGRYLHIEQLGMLSGGALGAKLGPDAKVLKIGGPAGGYLDAREAEVFRAAFADGAGLDVTLIAVRAPENDDVQSLNALLKQFDDWGISAIITALPVTDRRDLIYGLELLSCFEWDNPPLIAALAGHYYNPIFLREYIRDGLLSAALLQRPGEEEMIVAGEGNVDAIPDVSPVEADRYRYFERLGLLLGRMVGPGLEPDAGVLIIGGPPPKTYLNRRETAAVKNAFETGAGFSVRVVSVDAPRQSDADAFNAVIEPCADGDIDLVISLTRHGLPVTIDPDDPRMLTEYQLEHLSVFNRGKPPKFAAMAGTVYEPEALKKYIMDGLLDAVALYPPGGGRKIVIGAANIDEMPEISPFTSNAVNAARDR